MRICIYGAGAIGGFLGAGLALAGAKVTLIARGPHLEAMQKHGLKLIEGDRIRQARVHAVADPVEAGEQDYIIVTLKAHSVPPVVDSFAPMLGRETAVVWGVNGIPWWYFYGLEGSYRDRRLPSLDPDDQLWTKLGPERMIGCAVYPAAEVIEPGTIRHIEGERFSLGEPSGERSERVKQLSRLLIEAGFKAPVRPRIRDELWVKLWGNLSFNPVSALTGSTLASLGRDKGTREVIRAMMVEGQADRGSPRRAFSGGCRQADERCHRSRRTQDINAAGSGTGTSDGDRCIGRSRAGHGENGGPPDTPYRRGAGTGETARPRSGML